VSKKGSYSDTNMNPLVEEPDLDIMPTMGLYVNDDHYTRLVALGKVYEGASTIHHMHLTNDVVKVDVEEVQDVDVQVPFTTLEIQCVG